MTFCTHTKTQSVRDAAQVFTEVKNHRKFKQHLIKHQQLMFYK